MSKRGSYGHTERQKAVSHSEPWMMLTQVRRGCYLCDEGHDVMELGPTKEVKRRARRFRHDNEEARMKRLGTEGMEGQMPVQWAGDGFRDKMKTGQDAQRWPVRMS